MQRLAVPLVIAGSVAVLAMLYLLQRSLGSDPETPEAARAPARAGEPTATAPTPPPPATAVPRAALPPIPQRPVTSSAPAAPTGERPQLADERPPKGVLTDDNLEYGTPQLGAQIAAVEPLVAECVRRTTAAGHKLSGRAELTFIIAQRKDQVVVEDTGVDAEQTTIDNAPLLECLHDTSRAMKFKGLPRSAEALIVTRRVDVADGALVSNAFVKFSYIR